ncbi:transposase [Caloramator proteoclasticus]|uniref:REP element-mobilizing transposase RayT n=1 Tax=Caloramator proteoclasticus DSM 10124 TaxID=1121262 RepID=A0A1M4XF38_9CLOT|nr:transposase [Caloramator proteoclasticus]SHE92135.1 REP element-mobilizing transposase RayT [Caloramator proteoclasticus DSM 10124]
MPRMAREKSYDSIYHIMVKSISEVNLFKDDEDKINYLNYMKKAQEQFEFIVYAYCLMDNHAHFIIDANGADISKIMHFINYKYAMCFNKRHKRHGHLFQDRFKSKIVKSERYLFALTAYVHFNATAIKGYEDHPEEYSFSSLAIYLGLKKDNFDLIDDVFVLSMFGLNDVSARVQYRDFIFKVKKFIDIQKEEFSNEPTEYRSMRKILVRDFSPEKIILIIMQKFNINKYALFKYRRDGVEAKALICFILRKLCDLKCADICKLLGNIGQARVSRLCSIGAELVRNKKYECIINEILQQAL